MDTIRQRNTMLLFCLVVVIMLYAAITLAINKMPAPPVLNSVTNFYCEMRGVWSNHHFDIKSAVTYGTEGMWRITYRDSGESTMYLQRPGEDCRVLTLPKPDKQ